MFFAIICILVLDEMKKIKTILAFSLKCLIGLLLVLIAFLVLAIPYGKHTEKEMTGLGVNYQNVVIKGVHIIQIMTC